MGKVYIFLWDLPVTWHVADDVAGPPELVAGRCGEGLYFPVGLASDVARG